MTENTEWWTTKVYVDGVDWSDSLISYDTHRIEYQIPGTDRKLRGPAGFAAFFRYDDKTSRRDEVRSAPVHQLRTVVGDNYLQLPVRLFATTADGQTLGSTFFVGASVEKDVPYLVPVEPGVEYVSANGFTSVVRRDPGEGGAT